MKQTTRKPTPEELQNIIQMTIGLFIAEEIKNKVVPEIINGEIAKLQKENTELKEKLRNCVSPKDLGLSGKYTKKVRFEK